jgi:hypothetical protein
MKIRILMKQGVGVGLLLLSGCEMARNARADLAKLTSSPPAASSPSQARKATPPRVAGQSPASSAADPLPIFDAAPVESAAAPSRVAPPVDLAGASENKLRALLGAPSSEEDHPPGKRWQYRDGKCTLDIQLYPDVQTKQLGTLAYKVKSNDNTDEGQRLCLAELQSRLQARR